MSTRAPASCVLAAISSPSSNNRRVWRPPPLQRRAPPIEWRAPRWRRRPRSSPHLLKQYPRLRSPRRDATPPDATQLRPIARNATGFDRASGCEGRRRRPDSVGERSSSHPLEQYARLRSPTRVATEPDTIQLTLLHAIHRASIACGRAHHRRAVLKAGISATPRRRPRSSPHLLKQYPRLRSPRRSPTRLRAARLTPGRSNRHPLRAIRRVSVARDAQPVASPV